MNPSRLRLFGVWSAASTVLVVVFACNSYDPPVPVSASIAPTAQSTSLDSDQLRSMEQMRASLFYLASDELEGRGVETEGLDKAAEYIADRFREGGIKPLPALDGYFQPFKVNLSAAVGEKTHLTLGNRQLALNSEFVPMGISAEGSFSAPIAFVGYSISSDEFKYDDYAGVDVKGKVALALRYEPTDEQGKSRFEPDGRSDHATFQSKAKAAAEHGAVALLIVNPPYLTDPNQLQPPEAGGIAPEDPTTAPAREEPPDQLLSLQRSGGPKAEIPVIQIRRDVASEILRSAGAEDLEALRRQIDGTGKPRSFVLKHVTATGHVEMQRRQREIRNVVAHVPGVGAEKNEYIVVGAHYDHLGRGESGSLARLNRGEIHNGADDNASGTVAMLQIARAIAKRPMKHTVVFIAFSGEERGLLGSSHFVENPPIPLENVVTMINLDMVGRLEGDALGIGGTGTAEEFDSILAQVEERSSLRMKPAAGRVGGRGGLGPSDHASFARKKIPVLFFWTGNHADYHRPTDDADKINYEGMLHIVNAAVELIDLLDQTPPTQYVDKFDSTEMVRGTARVRLGIMPDYNDEDQGVKVASTFPNTPAAEAGIQDGDLIVQIGEDKISNINDYMTALNKHKPGDTITIGVMRKGERLDLQTKLTGGRG